MRTEDKVERWRKHFESVTIVPTEFTESSQSKIPHASLHGVDGHSGDKINSMMENRMCVCVPTKEKIREPN